MLLLLFFNLFAYLLGSLSSAILICRFSGLPDPRSQGSKNPGASNVLRIGGKTYAAWVLFLDVLKGWVPVFLAKQAGVLPSLLGWVAFFAFLGHLYPIFFKFRGGKGVATALGGLFAVAWPLTVMALISWGIVIAWSRIISLASIVAAGVVCGYALYHFPVTQSFPLILMGLLLIVRHHSNIRRLIKGEESKITNKIKNN